MMRIRISTPSRTYHSSAREEDGIRMHILFLLLLFLVAIVLPPFCIRVFECSDFPPFLYPQIVLCSADLLCNDSPRILASFPLESYVFVFIVHFPVATNSGLCWHVTFAFAQTHIDSITRSSVVKVFARFTRAILTGPAGPRRV
ncbi:T. brucei spp.-specific protein [Trypanosoma brucei gambiense DAL972]|uniref:T. brucei spp.-specific protein n=1 Tax=Trypanosoma brucei gambiense (strain MHOM/CI/86/DAL972) TaxID=679716 RepID=D0A9H5_TRYB9|nr:T. brucei spp.-specific protein [Trypanosoma brucei gambiense DAL972]CBH18326.1 T. brucei spp.-specific protein [Trypanosoma brucei gambiense DAL972]|eukprot:XP_011780590.1 T. brucei spp.-specific protein [Trypanosoma brucei gambiense DAL972]